MYRERRIYKQVNNNIEIEVIAKGYIWVLNFIVNNSDTCVYAVTYSLLQIYLFDCIQTSTNMFFSKQVGLKIKITWKKSNLLLFSFFFMSFIIPSTTSTLLKDIDKLSTYCMWMKGCNYLANFISITFIAIHWRGIANIQTFVIKSYWIIKKSTLKLLEGMVSIQDN